jgi:hypothetical protein
VARLAERWPRYLETLGPGDLDEGVGYRNSRGEYWTSTVGDILTHVAMHGTYHRAQIAAAVRESGGLLLWSGSLSWFGHLPGDIRIERETVRIYIPITSMVILSVVLSLVLYLIRRFF